VQAAAAGVQAPGRCARARLIAFAGRPLRCVAHAPRRLRCAALRAATPSAASPAARAQRACVRCARCAALPSAWRSFPAVFRRADNSVLRRSLDGHRPGRAARLRAVGRGAGGLCGALPAPGHRRICTVRPLACVRFCGFALLRCALLTRLRRRSVSLDVSGCQAISYVWCASRMRATYMLLRTRLIRMCMLAAYRPLTRCFAACCASIAACSLVRIHLLYLS
jgi:hypothetical protein